MGAKTDLSLGHAPLLNRPWRNDNKDMAVQAAPSLTKMEISRTVGNKVKKKLSVKTVLCAPYKVTWPRISRDIEQEIVRSIQSTFEPLDIGKISSLGGKKQNRRKSIDKTDAEENRKASIRQEYVVGIKTATRCLEKDMLRLLVVDKDAKPALLTHHLVQLSAVRGCPAVCITGLAQTLAPILKFTSTLALGIKKSDKDSVFDCMVNYIQHRAREIKLPWLNSSSDLLCDSKKNELEETMEESISKTSVHEESTENVQVDTASSSSKADNCPKTGLDFSELYILKKDAHKYRKPQFEDASFGNDSFIAFGTSESEQTPSDKHHSRKRSKPEDSGSISTKNVKKQEHSTLYQKVNVGRLQANTNKLKKKNKKI